MKTITNKQFKIHCNDSTLEYAGDGIYNFYDLSTDFWINFNVINNEFESGVQLSASQLIILGNRIIDFHRERLREESQEQERYDVMEDPTNDAFFNTQNL